jgi:PrgI family protein
MTKKETKILQYKVPQDVQREDTIIGPLTLKQLIMLGAGGGLAYVIYVSLAKAYYIEIWLPPVIIVSLITLAFTFLKVHSLPFHLFLMNLIEFRLLPKKRGWVQGAGNPFFSPFQSLSKKEKKVEKVAQKKTPEKGINELSSIVDQYSKPN